ncbi:MAG: DUF835 domain-containing protein [Thermoplasmata archaeon]|nr:DUF835 domain-containing protein [Thermoplasmata archaeon]
MDRHALQHFCIVVFLTLLVSLFLSVVSAQGNRIIVTTDVEMIGTTGLSGGGHIYFTAVGAEALDLRKKILYRYDDGDGVIEADEALAYSLDVQDYLENPPWGTFGTDYRYGRIKDVSLEEGNSEPGVQQSSSGLVGSEASTIASLSMTHRFTMETDQARRTYVQDEIAVARAFYDVFSVNLTTDFETVLGPYLYFPWPNPGGTLYAGNVTTWMYENDTRMVMDSEYLRLNSSTECFLHFNYTGNVANGGDYLAFLTSVDGVNWNEIYNLSVSNGTSSWMPVSLDLTEDLAGMEFFLRLLFKSDSVNNAEGFRLNDLAVIAPSTYEGSIEMHHTDYLLGLTSFQDVAANKGTVHIIRTPGGMILSYTSDFDYAASGQDKTVFVDFDVFENPQILFILIFILTYAMLSAQNRSYMVFKMAHPRRYRAGAVKIKWLHILGKVFVLLYIIFYFFPSLLVFVGAGVYLSGLFMWIFTIATFVAMVVMTKVMYDRKTMMIPPAVEEEDIHITVEGAAVSEPEAPPPPPVHSTLACTVCMDEITSLREAVRCKCGQIYHKSCATKVATCPACGNDLDVDEEEEKKMTTAKCGSCSEVVLIEEGADLMRTMCENCGSALKVVEPGYNHLVVGDTPTVAYEQFNSLMKKNLAGLIISTTYPEKLKREISIENVELYWLTDTSSDFQTLDPKRLDFEIMRAISNFVKKSDGGVILLDGLEYLAVENGFEVSLKFIKKVNDLCSINDATLVVPITPLSLALDQLSMLKKEFDRVEDVTGP